MSQKSYCDICPARRLVQWNHPRPARHQPRPCASRRSIQARIPVPHQERPERMSIDLTQQALNALADAGLGNDSPAEAYVIGYTQGHDDALALAIQLERSINRRPFMPDEAERLAMRLHEQVGDCPIAHESGKAMDDSEREWWVNLAASAWTLIDGTEETE